MIQFLKSLFKSKPKPELPKLYDRWESIYINEKTSIHDVPLGSVIELRNGDFAVIDDYSFEFRSTHTNYGIKLYGQDYFRYFITHQSRGALVFIPKSDNDSINWNSVWINNKERGFKELQKEFPKLKLQG